MGENGYNRRGVPGDNPTEIKQSRWREAVKGSCTTDATFLD
jgi:hypothetical protein